MREVKKAALLRQLLLMTKGGTQLLNWPDKGGVFNEESSLMAPFFNTVDSWGKEYIKGKAKGVSKLTINQFDIYYDAFNSASCPSNKSVYEYDLSLISVFDMDLSKSIVDDIKKGVISYFSCGINSKIKRDADLSDLKFFRDLFDDINFKLENITKDAVLSALDNDSYEALAFIDLSKQYYDINSLEENIKNFLDERIKRGWNENDFSFLKTVPREEFDYLGKLLGYCIAGSDKRVISDIKKYFSDNLIIKLDSRNKEIIVDDCFCKYSGKDDKEYFCSFISNAFQAFMHDEYLFKHKSCVNNSKCVFTYNQADNSHEENILEKMMSFSQSKSCVTKGCGGRIPFGETKCPKCNRVISNII